jgi:hypothetical protein
MMLLQTNLPEYNQQQIRLHKLTLPDPLQSIPDQCNQLGCEKHILSLNWLYGPLGISRPIKNKKCQIALYFELQGQSYLTLAEQYDDPVNNMICLSLYLKELLELSLSTCKTLQKQSVMN